MHGLSHGLCVRLPRRAPSCKSEQFPRPPFCHLRALIPLRCPVIRFAHLVSAHVRQHGFPNSAWRSASTSRACTIGSMPSLRRAFASSHSSLAFASDVAG